VLLLFYGYGYDGYGYGCYCYGCSGYGHGNGFGIVPLKPHRAIDLFIAYLGLSLKFTSSSFKNIHTLSDSIALPGKKDPKVMQ
jgi:hypothetical protein